MTTAPLSNLTATWNAGGTTFTAIKMNVTDTASAAGSLLLDLQVGGTSQFRVSKGGLVTAPRFALAGNVSSAAWTTSGIGLTNVARTLTDTSSSGTVALAYTNVLGGNTIAASSATTFTNYGTLQLGSPTAGTNVTITNSFSLVTAGNIGVGSTDVVLARDAANTLAQRNGTNAQTFRVYNTFTDASNYERGVFDWSTTSNALTIGTQNLGTGSQQDVRIVASSNIIMSPSNGLVIMAQGTIIVNTQRYRIQTPSDGVITFTDNATTSFNRLQFGGTTSSFPSLKRNGTALETKLADDSAYAPHAMQYLDVTDGITAPAAATGRARIYVDTADGDLKVIFADGTIKTIVTDT